MKTEGEMIILIYKWYFFQSWERVYFKISNSLLEYRNQNISSSVELALIHSLRCASNSSTMLEMQIKQTLHYFYFDTEREKDAFYDIVSDKILNSYAIGFGDVGHRTVNCSHTLGDVRWQRRRAFLTTMYLLRVITLRRLDRIRAITALLLEDNVCSLPYLTKMELQKELRYLGLLVPSPAFRAIFVGENSDFVKLITYFL